MAEDISSLVREVMGDGEDKASAVDEGTRFEAAYDDFMRCVGEHFEAMGEVGLRRLQNVSEQRFSDSLPLEKARDVIVALVGCGGLGNHIWKVLFGMGFRRLHVFDDDVVGPENIGPQMHKAIDLGLFKVEAVRREALAFRGMEIAAHPMLVTSFQDVVDAIGAVPDVLIGATDSPEFRNAIIRGFNVDSRLPLFIDLRMSLGDWNAFAFTPALFPDHGSFREAYDRYEKLAVFERGEAVQEPCTARAITYTGANVASYVGAFMHWWIREGRDKCASDRNFLKNSFYSGLRHGDDFNWLYRYSSKEFLPETMTERQSDMMAKSVNGSMAMKAIENMMEGLWCGVGTVGFGKCRNKCSSARFPEGYLDLDGHMRMYQAYDLEVGDYNVAMGVDLDFGRAEAKIAAWRYDPRVEKFVDVERKLADRISGGRLYTEYAGGDSTFAALSMDILERRDVAAKLARYLLDEENLRKVAFQTIRSVVFVRRLDERSELDVAIGVELRGGERDDASDVWTFNMFTWKAEEGVVEIAPDSVPRELSAAYGDAIFGTGWKAISGEERKVFKVFPLEGEESDEEDGLSEETIRMEDFSKDAEGGW